MHVVVAATTNENHEEKSSTQLTPEALEAMAAETSKTLAKAWVEIDRVRSQLKELRASHVERTNVLLQTLTNVEEWMMLARRAKRGETAEARQLAASLIVEKLLVFELPENAPDCEKSEESEISTCSTCDGHRRVHFDDTSSSVPCPDCRGEL
jgi:hypothetical protein